MIEEAVAGARRLGSYLHVPAQSGSRHDVLGRMHRGYTRERTTSHLSMRCGRPTPAFRLSTDIIVGFPGESDADFEQSMSLVDAVRFSQLFGFVYSPRPRTPAARYDGRLAHSVAAHRLERLFALQTSDPARAESAAHRDAGSRCWSTGLPGGALRSGRAGERTTVSSASRRPMPRPLERSSTSSSRERRPHALIWRGGAPGVRPGRHRRGLT